MKIMLIKFLEAIATVFAAEFAAGAVHWLEDAYIREDTPLVGRRIGRPNTVHHHFPRYMTRRNWLHTSWDLVLVGAAVLLGAWALGVLTWQVWLFVLISVNANEIHKWAHQTRKENGRVVSFLQDIGLLQSARHHAKHHTDPKNVHYCTITNYLNPVLDGLGFWDRMEWLLEKTVGLRRREDTSVRGHGPGPAWLAEYRMKPAAVKA